MMGISYRLYHHDSRTWINLGKILSQRSEQVFEGHGDEAAMFLATRPYGTFELCSDNSVDPEWRDEEANSDNVWTETNLKECRQLHINHEII